MFPRCMSMLEVCMSCRYYNKKIPNLSLKMSRFIVPSLDLLEY